ETLRPFGRDGSVNDPVDRPVERRARAEPRERPELRLRRPPARRIADQDGAELRALRRGEPLAAADRLPHLAHLLRARPRALRLAASEERRPDLLQEVFLLPRCEAARDALPEIPPLRAALQGARMPG